MVDYTQPTGSGGFVMIRDLGSDIQFIIGTSSSTTNAFGKSWSGQVGPFAVGGTFNYPAGSGSIVVATFDLSGGGAVSFTMGATGTFGLGGPTTVTANITRATVPQAPTSLGLDLIAHTSMRFRFSGNGNGGSAIIEYQAAYGTDPNTAQVYVIANSGVLTPTNLLMGTTYYFWSRGRNAIGWGPWSVRASEVTLAGARVKLAGVWVNAIPYVKVAGVWKTAVPYIKVAGVWSPST